MVLCEYKFFAMNRQEISENIYKMNINYLYINRKFLGKNKNKEFDYMRSKEAKFFINDIYFENLYIDMQLNLKFARNLKMNY